MKLNIASGFAIFLFICSLAQAAGARGSWVVDKPAEHVYAVHGGVDLKAYLFSPPPQPEARAAIVVFHGGGWSVGEPEWAFSTARHFARQGMVAIAAQYRLSDQKTITPLEAMADAQAVIRWMRARSDFLGIDPERIAAYGWSAGAHLAACAAIFDDTDSESRISPAPNALILKSPAVSLMADRWVQGLLGDLADAREISPDEHVREGLPSTLILQCDVDTVTPLAGVKRFCDRMQAAGNTCELQLYEGYGHLFTPAGIPDDGMPKPDPAIQADALKGTDRFLMDLGFLR